MKYVVRQGLLVPKEECGPPAARSDLPAPFFSRFEPMESPVTGQMITSERQRQRDMTAADAYDPRDLGADHVYSRGREAQAKEARHGRRKSGPKPETMTNGATEPEAPRKSLREIAEAAYDEVESGIGPDEGDDGSQQPVDDRRPRARRIRSLQVEKTRETGEAAPQEPSPDETSAPQPDRPTQPRAGVAAGPPANWSSARP